MNGKACVLESRLNPQTPPTPASTPPAAMTVTAEPPDNLHGAVVVAAKATPQGVAAGPLPQLISATSFIQDSAKSPKQPPFSFNVDQKAAADQLLITQTQNQADKPSLFPHLHSQLTQNQQRAPAPKKQEDHRHKFQLDDAQGKASAAQQKNQRCLPAADTPRSRSRRRARWKLKFHHQALPPEYLDHYEASLTRASGSPSTAANDSTQPARIIGSRAPRTGDRRRAPATPGSSAIPTPTPAPAPAPPPAVSVIGGPPHGITLEALLQFRALCAQNDDAAAVMARFDVQVQDSVKASRVAESTSTESARFSNKALLTNLLNNRARQSVELASPAARAALSSPPKRTPAKVMTFQDLPYMGEMTLDNVKPRRGRKPKKADICHLIYKNYGTVLAKGAEDGLPALPAAGGQRRSPVGASRVARPPEKTAVQRRLMSSLLERRLTEDVIERDHCEEPLNLCLRDLNQLKIRLLQKQSDMTLSPHSLEEKRPHSASSPYTMDIKSEPASPCPEGVLVEVDADPAGLVGSPSDDPDGQMDEDGPSYWPGASHTPLYVHPLQLYSLGSFGASLQGQALASGSATAQSSCGPLDAEALCARLGYESPDSPPTQTDGITGLSSSPAITPPLTKRPQATQSSSADGAPDAAVAPPTASTPDTWTTSNTAKRKRSAIFVPSVASESANATTEVSICKFKFTGGERPVLQKKKMLSVDAGGNFRYYSGPSDERLFSPSPAPPPRSSTSTPMPAPAQTDATRPSPNPPGSPVRKKKSKKSLAREKLEKTFKEKGFLIQTQQLESAEGATYCKFRQLRKFTRYLFRSWKDYLPGNVRDMSLAAGGPMEQNPGLQDLLPIMEEEPVGGME